MSEKQCYAAMKYIVGYTHHNMQTYAVTNIITTFTYKCPVTRAYAEQTNISFEAPSGSLLASLWHYLGIICKYYA